MPVVPVTGDPGLEVGELLHRRPKVSSSGRAPL
jgi:hypothetical protein